MREARLVVEQKAEFIKALKVSERLQGPSRGSSRLEVVVTAVVGRRSAGYGSSKRGRSYLTILMERIIIIMFLGLVG